MTDQPMTPPRQAPPPGTTSPPATPGPSTFAEISPRTATPGRVARRRNLVPTTTPPPPSSPVPNCRSRTPRPTTPRTSVPPCATDEVLFAIVTVHTAKCSECDKRNTDIMRRCPGCTFQVCQRCFDRREREGRGLMHGNMMSVMGGGIPRSPRTVRKKVSASTPGDDSVSKDSNKDGDDGEVKTAEGSREKVKAFSKPSTKKRLVRKRSRRAAFDSEDDLDEGEEDFVTNLASPTPGKRRRTAPYPDDTTSSLAKRTLRNSCPARSKPDHQELSAAHSEITVDSSASTGARINELGINGLMNTFGVNTPENPYQSHLLSRHEPVVSNPVIEIPDIVRRGFKPRPTQKEIQSKIQESTLRKLHDKAFVQTERAQQEQAEEDAYRHTVDALAETVAGRYQDEDTMDAEQIEDFVNATKATARQWARQTYNGLSPTIQESVRTGGQLRLDMIHPAHTIQLTKLMEQCATDKLQKLAEENVPAIETHSCSAGQAACIGPADLTE